MTRNTTPDRLLSANSQPAATTAPADNPTQTALRERAEQYLNEAQGALFDDHISDEVALSALDKALQMVAELQGTAQGAGLLGAPTSDPIAQEQPATGDTSLDTAAPLAAQGVNQLKLYTDPDRFGFIAGTADYSGRVRVVGVLPPLDQWQGEAVPLDSMGADQRDPASFIIFADGLEIARTKELPASCLLADIAEEGAAATTEQARGKLSALFGWLKGRRTDTGDTAGTYPASDPVASKIARFEQENGAKPYLAGGGIVLTKSGQALYDKTTDKVGE